MEIKVCSIFFDDTPLGTKPKPGDEQQKQQNLEVVHEWTIIPQKGSTQD